MGRYDSMINSKFGKLLVIEVVRERGDRARVACKCECGAKKVISASSVLTGNTRSCGCMNNKSARAARKLTHGHRHHPLYKTWNNIIHRCHDEKRKDYKYYGQKGIFACDEWRFGVDGMHPFLVFLRDMGEKPEGATVDRIDNSLGYSKDNCKWSSMSEQSRNTGKNVWIHLPGESLILKDFCSVYGFNKDTLSYRVSTRGISFIDAAKQLYEANQ